jgi:SAM-dependent methyltransferase
MTETRFAFDDGAAYERFMGRWSRAVGTEFLAWVAPPKAARWLDVGCGTGVFTQLIRDGCAPASIVAVDPSAEQIDHARRQPIAQHADFRVADAMELPFADGSFDVVASALVINFIPDRPRALRQARRVTRPGGLVAKYVWDFAGGRATGVPMQRGLKAIGVDSPRVPGTEDSTVEALESLFKTAGFRDIATKPIDVSMTFRDFDDYWQSQTPSHHPSTKIIAGLPEQDRQRLRETVSASLPAAADGTITYSARANAIKARAPG